MSKLMLARMYFECNNAVVRRSLETYGVNPATALEYLLQAADVNNDCEAHVLLGKLHLQGPEGFRGRPTDLPAGVKSPVPFNAEKSLDHFKKAIESYDALAEPKVLETGFVPEHILWRVQPRRSSDERHLRHRHNVHVRKNVYTQFPS